MMLALFASLAVAATFAGGYFPFARQWLSREAMARLFSVRAGILIAVAFTELLPEAWHHNPSIAGWASLAAFVSLYAIGHFAMLDSCPEYLAECHVHYLGWTAFLALFFHSLIDGFNLGVSFSAGIGVGVAVGLAMALHKLADGFTLMSLFHESGYGRGRSLILLCAVSAVTPIAAFAGGGVAGFPPATLAGLLGFAAGSFIYIAASDVLPRLHSAADRWGLLYFGLGLLGMAALKNL